MTLLEHIRELLGTNQEAVRAYQGVRQGRMSTYFTTQDNQLLLPHFKSVDANKPLFAHKITANSGLLGIPSTKLYKPGDTITLTPHGTNSIYQMSRAEIDTHKELDYTMSVQHTHHVAPKDFLALYDGTQRGTNNPSQPFSNQELTDKQLLVQANSLETNTINHEALRTSVQRFVEQLK